MNRGEHIAPRSRFGTSISTSLVRDVLIGNEWLLTDEAILGAGQVGLCDLCFDAAYNGRIPNSCQSRALSRRYRAYCYIIPPQSTRTFANKRCREFTLNLPALTLTFLHAKGSRPSGLTPSAKNRSRYVRGCNL